MTDEDEPGSDGKRYAGLALGGLGLVMLAGAIAGFLGEHQAQGGGPLGPVGIAVLAVFVAMIGGIAYAMWRTGQKIRLTSGEETRREKLNRQILVACCVLGALIGVVLAIGGDLGGGGPDLFSDGPIAAGLAVLVVFTWCVIMPVIAWFWHTRAIDEQEASAYRDGGYYAGYLFLIGAPAWWFLWRGGLVPAPNGVAIYLIFACVWTAVWFWKKYR